MRCWCCCCCCWNWLVVVHCCEIGDTVIGIVVAIVFKEEAGHNGVFVEVFMLLLFLLKLKLLASFIAASTRARTASSSSSVVAVLQFFCVVPVVITVVASAFAVAITTIITFTNRNRGANIHSCFLFVLLVHITGKESRVSATQKLIDFWFVPSMFMFYVPCEINTFLACWASRRIFYKIFYFESNESNAYNMTRDRRRAVVCTFKKKITNETQKKANRNCRRSPIRKRRSQSITTTFQKTRWIDYWQQSHHNITFRITRLFYPTSFSSKNN